MANNRSKNVVRVDVDNKTIGGIIVYESDETNSVTITATVKFIPEPVSMEEAREFFNANFPEEKNQAFYFSQLIPKVEQFVVERELTFTKVNKKEPEFK